MLTRPVAVADASWMQVRGELHAILTVHGTAEKLDTGEIILQTPVPIYAADSLHDLMVRSKRVGVQALLEAVGQIERGPVRRQPMDMCRASCFSFPKRADAQRLRRMGHALL